MTSGMPIPHKAFDRSLGALTLCLLMALAAGCSSDDGESTPSDIQPLDDSVADASDPDGDDRPGLVVAELNGQSAEEVTSPWLVNMFLFRNDSVMPPTGGLGIGLVQYRNDFAVSAHLDFFQNDLDTCELRREDTASNGGGEDDGSSPPPRISGGSTVTINSPSGPWIILPEQSRENGEGVEYARPFGELPGELPAGATLSIPGAAFPTVAGYPLVEPPTPIRLLPDRNDPLNSNTVYTWVPGNGTDFIFMTFIAQDSDSGDFIDFPIVCSVIDDGRFEMPDDARAFIDTTTDTLTMRYERAREIVELANGIVFHTITIVAD